MKYKEYSRVAESLDNDIHRYVLEEPPAHKRPYRLGRLQTRSLNALNLGGGGKNEAKTREDINLPGTYNFTARATYVSNENMRGKHDLFGTHCYSGRYDSKGKENIMSPKVVDFDSSRTIPYKKHLVRGVAGFFPPVKKSILPADFCSSNPSRTNTSCSQPFHLELAPMEGALDKALTSDRLHGGERGKSTAEKNLRLSSEKSRVSTDRTRLDRGLFAPAVPNSSPAGNPPVGATFPASGMFYPHLLNEKNSAEIAHARVIISRANVPWVYRQKVKQSRNEVYKLLASKPQHVVE